MERVKEFLIQTIDSEIAVLLKNYEERNNFIRSSTQMFVIAWIILIFTTILLFARVIIPRGSQVPLLLLGLQLIMLAYVSFYNLTIRMQRRSLQLIEEQINLLLGKYTTNYELDVAKTFSNFQKPVYAIFRGDINPIKFTSWAAALAGYASYLSSVVAYFYFSNFNISQFMLTTVFFAFIIMTLFLYADRTANRRFNKIRKKIIHAQIKKWERRLGFEANYIEENIDLGIISLLIDGKGSFSSES